MVRLIKRYESRKLYDTEESRYVSLEDIAAWVRGGQEVRVVDNATAEDVTAQTLTQIILDEGRRGTSFLPSELLHELVRVGERAVTTGVFSDDVSVSVALTAISFSRVLRSCTVPVWPSLPKTFFTSPGNATPELATKFDTLPERNDGDPPAAE